MNDFLLKNNNNFSRTLKRLSLILVSLILTQHIATQTTTLPQQKDIRSLSTADIRNLYYLKLGQKIQSLSDYRDCDKGVKIYPEWKKIYQSSNSEWNIIEIPLSYKKDKLFKIMTEDVFRYVEKMKDKRVVAQEQRWVILQNKETGDIYNFVMYAIPSLPYLFNKGASISKNGYTKRESDFDGMILFHTTEGLFINGWIYEDGEIMLGVLPKETTSKYNPILRDYLKVCISTAEIYPTNDVYNTECFSTYIPPEWEQEGYVDMSQKSNFTLYNEDEDDDEDDYSQYTDNTISNTVENNINIPQKEENNTPLPTESSITKIQPKDSYCSPISIQCAEKAMLALSGSSDILNKIKQLQQYARNENHEFGLTINKKGKNFFIHRNEVKEGINGEVSSIFNVESALTIHTHHSSQDIRVTNFTGPSGNDINNVLAACYIILQNGGKDYMGTVIISYDASEYLLTVYDRNKANTFFQKNRNAFSNTSSRVGSFQNEHFRELYRSVRERLEDNGYSNQDAHDFATVYLFDKYNVGVKLLKKEPQSSIFKELQIKYDAQTDTFHTQICQ